jgi:multidrug efflux pump subunit AcrB
MTKFLLNRPIAVGMSFLALLIFSVLAYIQLPISLLPDIDVPKLAIRVDYPNTSAEAIEENVLLPIRQRMATMNGLEGMESVASNETALLSLSFAYGSRMDLAYVEANEKIDRLLDQFPKSMERPQVIRLNTADIPMLRVHVVPQEAQQMVEASLLTENVLKKRLEQIEGISLVDINGLLAKEIRVVPNRRLMQNYQLTDDILLSSIRAANRSLGGIQVKDGQYQYFMRMASSLEGLEDLKQLPIPLGTKDQKKFIALEKVAAVSWAEQKASGQHLYNGQPSIVLNLHKQHEADMTELIPQVETTLAAFRNDYPSLVFETTQDQSLFLAAGINNLLGSLFFGGLFAFAVLFLFMGSARLPFIMGISLPSSLIISFLCFKLLGLSINIISLSGLALGLGMLIDNAIIVLENINRKRAGGMALLAACSQGVSEVRGALISSVMTTLAVFVPLIFLSGITGVLFYDQALSVAIILVVSLLVSFILLPLLYKLFYSNMEHNPQQDSRLFAWLLRLFERAHQQVFRYPALFIILALTLLPAGYFASQQLTIRGMPAITRNDLVLTVNWQEPIGLAENTKRVQWLQIALEANLLASDADLGLSDYLLQLSNASLQEATLYLAFNSVAEKEAAAKNLSQLLKTQYPLASLAIGEAPNAFELLFEQDLPYLSYRWRPNRLNKSVSNDSLLQLLPIVGFIKGASLEKERNVVLAIDQPALLQYGINAEQLIQTIARLLTSYPITKLSAFSVETPIVLVEGEQGDFESLINRQSIQSTSGQSYPLKTFINMGYQEQYKHILADASGPYFNIFKAQKAEPAVEQAAQQSVENDLAALAAFTAEQALVADIQGSYFSNKAQLKEILYVLLVAVVLLYFILAAQFESFWQPLIVLFSLPFGISGALLFLWLGGASLNVMSGIGMVVMLGIMVNDAILKIDTINRNLAAKPEDVASLYDAVHAAGLVRLKPILMTSITTLLALSPVLVLGGLGAELQKPLVLSVMGGLTIGTGTALFLVPVLYFLLKRKNKII